MSVTIEKKPEVYDIPISAFTMLHISRPVYHVGDYVLVGSSFRFGRMCSNIVVLERADEPEGLLRRQQSDEDMDLYACVSGWDDTVYCSEVWHIVNDPNDRFIDYDDLFDEYLQIQTDNWNAYCCGLLDDESEPEPDTMRNTFLVYGYIGTVCDNNERSQAFFHSLNAARVYARRIVGYPFDSVLVYFDRPAYDTCSLIHYYRPCISGINDLVLQRSFGTVRHKSLGRDF